MFKEYKFQDPTKAKQKKQQIEKQYGYKFPVYKVTSPSGKEWLSIVQPIGLEPNPRKIRK